MSRRKESEEMTTLNKWGAGLIGWGIWLIDVAPHTGRPDIFLYISLLAMTAGCICFGLKEAQR